MAYSDDYIFRAEGLSVRYGETEALSGLPLSLAPGDFVALMGENGAGKSTFLNALNGILSPAEGSIRFNPAYMDLKNPYASIGFSSQRLIMDWYLRVEQNVYLGCILAGMASKEAKEAAQKAMERVHLVEKGGSETDELSGGQHQRVQIARAIAHSPQLYILDEPTTGLDAELAEEFFQFLHEEHQKGKTIIVSSHDLYLLEKYCTKLLYLEKGHVRYWGGMADFLRQYAPRQQFHIRLRQEAVKADGRTYGLIMEKQSDDPRSLYIELKEGRSLSEVLQELSEQYDVMEFQMLQECSLRTFFACKGERRSS